VQQAANGPKGPTDWQRVDWRQATRQVRNLRQRIFRASQAGDWKRVHSLQKLILRSYANRLLAVRRVTQLNQGRHTPGMDQVVVKTPKARGALVDELAHYQPWRVQPTKRVYIPKANGTLRPLGIPTVRDRALQAMVKNALEPSWEARFEGSSYGFRPGRSCHDAIGKVYLLVRPNGRKKWVVDADIEGAFDAISHQHLMQTLGPVPGRELIKQWLKAGYLERTVFHPTEAGTPQGGVLSPLLLNVALHGLEAALGIKPGDRNCRGVVRYADDLVVLCESRPDAETVLTVLQRWLAERGLALSEEKTRIVHLTEGFDYLGFTVRHYRAPQTSRSGYKLLITPSKASVQRIRAKLREEWLRLRGAPVAAVLHRLTPIIRGEANYFRVGVAAQTFGKLDSWMFGREVRWVKWQHPHKVSRWQKARYWGRFCPQRTDRWVFGDRQTGAYLTKFAWFPIRRHVLVRRSASPDDPQLQAYWRERDRATTRDLRPIDRRLAARQDDICPICGQSLGNGEELERHHVQWRSRGGTEEEANLVLLHLYCHQQLHHEHREVE